MASSKKRPRSQRSSTRKPFTRAMLLPLPVVQLRARSLELHLTLEALRRGHADIDLLARFYSALGTARRLHEATHGRDTPERADFEAGLQLLHDYASSRESGRHILPSEESMAALERVVSLHDRQLADTPVHLLLAMRKRAEQDLIRYVRSATAEPACVAGESAEPEGLVLSPANGRERRISER